MSFKLSELSIFTEQEIENALIFLRGYRGKKAEDLAAIEHHDGPIYDTPGVGYGINPDREDYDIGLTVAQRIIECINKTNPSTEPLSWQHLDDLVAIKGFGIDKFRDIVYSAKPIDPRYTYPNWDTKYRAYAKQYLEYWVSALDMRVNRPADEAVARQAITLDKDKKAFDRWQWTIRAICWVESRYGGGAGDHPAEDPLQCGNPKDTWKNIVAQQASGQILKRGWNYPDSATGTKFYYSNALAEIKDSTVVSKPVGTVFSDPVVYDFTLLNKPSDGHNDPKFRDQLSFFWGIFHLIVRTNQYSGTSRAYDCNNSTWEHLKQGAFKYGPGTQTYKQSVSNFLESRGVFAPTSQPTP